MERLWGEFVASTNKTWVAYSPDKKTRSRVDFEKGRIVIETITDNADDEPKVRKRVEDHLKKVLRKKPQGEDETVLKDQVQNTQGEIITDDKIDDFAQEVAQQSNLPKQPVVGNDHKKRTKHTVELPLAPNHIKIRAARYYQPIQKYAQQYGLLPELVFAIIHTESYFRPAVGSGAEAIGLMQLVPRSGGHDAYRYVYGKDEQPSRDFLCVPHNNIRLGCAYLHMLKDRTFGSVTNATNQRYCAIASYNTGAGNFSTAFTGNRNVSQAVSIINAMEPPQLYSHLRANLPYQETRDYIKKVVERMAQYKGWRG